MVRMSQIKTKKILQNERLCLFKVIWTQEEAIPPSAPGLELNIMRLIVQCTNYILRSDLIKLDMFPFITNIHIIII